MTILVRMFARCRDLVEAEAVTIEVRDGGTVADVRAALGEAFPALRGMLPRCAVAVNDDFAADDATLPAGASAALLPPVSGG